MGGLVIDASVAASWCFEDEASAFTDAVLEAVASSGARVPALWFFEMSNVLALAERRGRVDAARVSRFIDALLALPLQVDHRDGRALVPALVRVAQAHRLTAYDASYLELAMRTGSSMATRDDALRATAGQVGVPLFEA